MMMLMSLSRKEKEMKVNRKEKITHIDEKFVYKKKRRKKNFHPEIKYNRLKHVRMWVEPK